MVVCIDKRLEIACVGVGRVGVERKEENGREASNDDGPALGCANNLGRLFRMISVSQPLNQLAGKGARVTCSFEFGRQARQSGGRAQPCNGGKTFCGAEIPDQGAIGLVGYGG